MKNKTIILGLSAVALAAMGSSCSEYVTKGYSPARVHVKTAPVSLERQASAPVVKKAAPARTTVTKPVRAKFVPQEVPTQGAIPENLLEPLPVAKPTTPPPAPAPAPEVKAPATPAPAVAAPAPEPPAPSASPVAQNQPVSQPKPEPVSPVAQNQPVSQPKPAPAPKPAASPVSQQQPASAPACRTDASGKRYPIMPGQNRRLKSI